MSTDRIILAACWRASPCERSGTISVAFAAGLPGAELAPAALIRSRACASPLSP